MDSGAPENSDNNSTKISFPASVVDDKGETWELQSDSGYSKDNAEYRCRKTGKYTNIPYYIRTKIRTTFRITTQATMVTFYMV